MCRDSSLRARERPVSTCRPRWPRRYMRSGCGGRGCPSPDVRQPVLVLRRVTTYQVHMAHRESVAEVCAGGAVLGEPERTGASLPRNDQPRRSPVRDAILTCSHARTDAPHDNLELLCERSTSGHTYLSTTRQPRLPSRRPPTQNLRRPDTRTRKGRPNSVLLCHASYTPPDDGAGRSCARIDYRVPTTERGP